jgi:hypothetical protein
MKLYRCNCYDKDQGSLVSWHASKADAERELRKWQKDRGEDARGPEGVDAVEIPTDRRGLLAWLNANISTDNG